MGPKVKIGVKALTWLVAMETVNKYAAGFLC